MSILDELNEPTTSGVFGIVAAPRLYGKSTLAGTLPGKTLFLQAARIETGSQSAKKLALEYGHHLDVRAFSSLAQLFKILPAVAASDYDNLYIDGITAVTEMKYGEPEIQKMLKKDNWGAFREIGKVMYDFILECKGLSEDTGKNVFLTLALDPQFDSVGNIVSIKPEVKGNATLSHIKGMCPVIVVPVETTTEDGKSQRILITQSDGVWPARIDNLLSHENPGSVLVDGAGNGLATVIKLAKGE